MSFSVARDGDRVVIGIPSQLIVGNRQELKQCVLAELERGTRRFVLDFRDTRHVDSAALGALLAISKNIRQQAGELRLANLNKDLETLLELTRLDTVFQVDDDDSGLGRTEAPR